MTGRLQWFARRLRSMGPGELTHRIKALRHTAALRREQATRWRDWPRPREVSAFSFCTARRPLLTGLVWDLSRLAGEVPAGPFDVLGHPWTWHDDASAWHTAPDTGRRWPGRFFSSVPYRPGNPSGDVRLVWEPSRLQQLVAAALLADGAGEDTAPIERVLESWVRSNPPYRGVHYVSAMECALRVLAVCHALDLVRGTLARPVATWSACLNLVESHARLIERRPSLHSSAGNHTLAESAGLIYAGALFPELPRASRWLARGLATFAREIDRQLLPDGGGIERSLHYTWFITDLCGLVVALLEALGKEVPQGLPAAARRGRDFLAAFASSPDRLPALGDADDGVALSPALSLSWRRDTSPAIARIFPDSGYTVLRGAAARLVFDHGPLGMAPLFGHGHADGLAIDLRVGDRPVLADCGTYTYNGDPAWRRYFRGTRSHNTVTVDGADQARQDGAFLWSRPYDCRLVDHSESGGVTRLLAVLHSRMTSAVHWRGVAWDPRGGLLVWDHLAGDGRHALELNWHVPLSVTESSPGHWQLDAGQPVGLTVTGPGTDLVQSAGDGPGPGWLSRRYGEREPIRTIQRRYEGRLPCTWQTTVVWAEADEDDPARWSEALAAFEERV